MKRWRYIIAAAMVAGNMAESAGAVYYEQVPQNVINDATTAYCQLWQSGALYQNLATEMDVDGEQASLTPLFPGTTKYRLALCGRVGVVDVETGEIILPVEYSQTLS